MQGAAKGERKWCKMIDISGISTKQARVIDSLLSQPTTRGAAKTAGVGEATVRRWLKLPEFREALRRGRADRYDEVLSFIVGAGNQAAAQLLVIMADKDSPKTCRVRAAEILLQHGRAGINEQDILTRIESLERIIHEKFSR